MNINNYRFEEEDIIPTYKNIESHILIYPNPSTGIITINLNGKKNVQIAFYDIVGKLIFATTLNENTSISLKDISEGIYTAKIKTETGNELVQKLVIVK